MSNIKIRNKPGEAKQKFEGSKFRAFLFSGISAFFEPPNLFRDLPFEFRIFPNE